MKSYCVTYRRSYEDTIEDKGSLRETMFHSKELYEFSGDKKNIVKDINKWRIESIFGV